MKMKRFSIHFGLSFALISGYLAIPPQLAQAQVASDTDITTDVSDMAPGLLPSIKLAIASDQVLVFIVVSSDILARLRTGTLFEQLLAAVLTEPTSGDIDSFVQALVNEGIPEDQATALTNLLQGLLSDVEATSSLTSNSQSYQNWVASRVTPTEVIISQANNEDQKIQNDLGFRIDQAQKLDQAIKKYNRWLASLELETLQNPPMSLQTIRQVLFDLSNTTRTETTEE